VSLEGRVVAIILMVAGVGLAGTFTGYVSSWFVQDEIEKDEERDVLKHQAVMDKIDRLEAVLEDMKTELKSMQQSMRQ
jgi:voltage-gated potassium channel